MTTPDPTGMLGKIRALLAKAEDPAATPQEAETYTAKAAELIAKYGIDAALLAANETSTVRLVPGDKIISVEAPYARDKADLLHVVTQALRCRTVQINLGGGAFKVHVFGFTADLERAELLYTSLLIQQASELAVTPVPWGENTAAFRRSWMLGYRQAVFGRLKAAERRAAGEAETATGPGVALVLADRNDMVSRRVEEAYPDLRKGRTRSLTGTGRRSGYRSGQKANLGGTGIGGGSRAIRADAT
jgi:hypothetical protein